MDAESLAKEMFEAGSKLKGKTDSEIFYQDFKRFTAGKLTFGVGQITSLNVEELGKIKERLIEYIGEARNEQKVDMMFFMMTNILEQSTELICDGQGAEQLAALAFHLKEGAKVVTLPGVVSRKKQLIPALMIATEQ